MIMGVTKMCFLLKILGYIIQQSQSQHYRNMSEIGYI